MKKYIQATLIFVVQEEINTFKTLNFCSLVKSELIDFSIVISYKKKVRISCNVPTSV